MRLFDKIKNGEKIEEKTFLIDTTYRQFFTSIRCNEGMYLNKSNEINRPDPGFFVKNKEEVDWGGRNIWVASIINDVGHNHSGPYI